MFIIIIIIIITIYFYVILFNIFQKGHQEFTSITSPDPFCTRSSLKVYFSPFQNCSNWFSVAINHYLIWFENVHMFHAKLQLEVCPMYEVPPQIPEHCPFRLQPKQFHVIFHTFSSNLPAPAHASHPCHHHHHISTGRHPIIHTLLLQMSKPSHSAMPHHIRHTLNTQKTTNPNYAFCPSVTLQTSISPSYALLSPDYPDFQPSLPMSQSHKLTRSGHMLSISCPL